MPMSDEPLSGVKVLDLTTVLAGPFAAYQLGLLGADIIKVEEPGHGDVARELGSDAELRDAQMGTSFLAQNAGKRSVTVNLKTKGGREVLGRLISAADVLIENMRPGVLARLGFPWPRIHEINSRLVYCALSGFGQSGPLAGRPAYDQIIQGLAGMADVTGYPDGGPVRVGFPICDTLGGLAAALAVCAALNRRNHDGEGSFLDVSMLETAMTAMGWVVSDYLIGGRPPGRAGNENVTSAPSGTFRTADGQLNIAANTQAQFEAICRVCDRPDLLADARFRGREDRKQHRDELRAELEQTLLARPAAHWEAAFATAGIPAGRVLTVTEALEQEQVRQRDIRHVIGVPGIPPDRSVEILGSGIHVNERSLAPRSSPPTLGQHTSDVLEELGYTVAEIADLRCTGAI